MVLPPAPYDLPIAIILSVLAVIYVSSREMSLMGQLLCIFYTIADSLVSFFILLLFFADRHQSCTELWIPRHVLCSAMPVRLPSVCLLYSPRLLLQNQFSPSYPQNLSHLSRSRLTAEP